jgi:cold shock protein
VITAVVRWYSDRDGWGVLDAPEAPGGIFVAFPAIQMEGFKHLVAGQRVELELEGPLGFDQDGCNYRARSVRPLP